MMIKVKEDLVDKKAGNKYFGEFSYHKSQEDSTYV